MSIEKERIIKALFGLLLLLFIAPVATISCSNGWSVGNNSNELDSTFTKIISKDSVAHYYKESLRIGYDMWCFEHSQWEKVIIEDE